MTQGDVDEPIALVEPDPRWPALFEEEARRVRAAMRGVAACVEHVGSTAVPLVGKPIVDLLVGVRALEAGREAAPGLAAMGYEDFGEVFIPGRLYLRRRGPPHFNVAIAEAGGAFFTSQLAVRDYLRAHPAEARAYADEKRRAFDAGARFFSTYSRQKDAFVASLNEKAVAWARLGARE